MGLRISDFDFEKTLRDAVHLLDLGRHEPTGTGSLGKHRLTVCSRPARSEVSNPVLRAKGETGADIDNGQGVECGCVFTWEECADKHVMWHPLAVVGGRGRRPRGVL